MAQKSVILVTGATGQIGSELVPALRKIYGNENVIAGYNKTPPTKVLQEGPCEKLDVQYKEAIVDIVKKYNVDVIYHLASLLSATSEQLPGLAWDLNLVSLKHVLEIAKEFNIKKVFWPSSIGAFGPTTPRDNTPQRTVLEPTSLYGVTKVAGELLCNYFYTRHGVDVRSLRYPGIISIETMPGGGTTDYSVAIFYDAIQKGSYTCYLKPETYLPMMYMPDAIHAAISLMDAPSEKLTVRTSYNLTAFSFTPEMITKELQKHAKELKVDYSIDPVRQSIADSWPDSIDDSQAQLDWAWKPQYSFELMVKDCYEKLHARLTSN